MNKNWENEDIINYDLVSIAYFLSRRGIKKPPHELNSKTWREAYLKFYKNFSFRKSEQKFINRLKNLRDHFDSHLENERTGWMAKDGSPDKLSSLNLDVFNELEKLSDDKLWQRIRGLAITTYDVKEEKEFLKNKSKVFISEFSGQIKIDQNIYSIYNRSHGLVVDKLKDYLITEYNNRSIYNTQKIDLVMEVTTNKHHIFEVKTKIDSQSIYTAIGQLFTHALEFKNVEMWIVLPIFFNDGFIENLKDLSINIIFYEIKKNEVSFFKNM